MRLYFIRHGRQDSKLCNVDAGLSKEGIKQAEALRNRIIKLPGIGDYDAIYASNLLRAVQTAEIINFKKIKINIRENIKEIDFGKLTGCTDEYIKENYNEFEDLRKSAVNDIAFPGGECGRDVFNRAIKTIDEIIAENYNNVIVVSHGGTIRSIIAGLLKLDFSKKLLFGKGLENSSITEIFYNKSKGQFTLEVFNDYAHIENNKSLLRSAWKN